MNRTMIRTTILTLAALACAAAATAGDLPAQAQRIWAPTGDLVGLDNHATGAVQVLDGHGSEAKGAEDWQLLGKTTGSGLLGWHGAWDSGYTLDARAYGTNEQGGLTGRLGLWGAKPGHAKWSLVFRNADHYYDPTSEMRSGAFKYPPAPPALAVTPHLEWRMMDAGLGYRLGGVGLTLGFDRMCRDGSKSSLARDVAGTGPVGAETPGVRGFDTTRNGVSLGAAWAGGAADLALAASFRKTDGDRALDTRAVYTDDQQVWNLNLGGGWDLGPRLRVLGGVAAANLTSKGTETRTTETVSDGETKTMAGRLGLIAGLGPRTHVRLAGMVQDLSTDARQDDAGGVLYAVERERTRQELDLSVTDRTLARTRLQLRYRYRQADLDETTSEDDLPGGAAAGLTQLVAQDNTSHDATLKIRHRIDRNLQLRAKAAWRKLEVDETASGDDVFATLGDRERERLSWDLAVETRPARGLKLDLGWRGWDQALTLLEDGGVESSWQASTLFANLNWFAQARLSFFAAVSYGTETLDLAGEPAPTGTMGPVSYDGTTLRFMPGVTVQVLPMMAVDAIYEGVRFEDPAGESDLLVALESDHDRMLVRVRYSTDDRLTAAVTYRRNEFDENRWDDVIQDIWQASVSVLF
jgi:hypothetical protein